MFQLQIPLNQSNEIHVELNDNEKEWLFRSHGQSNNILSKNKNHNSDSNTN